MSDQDRNITDNKELTIFTLIQGLIAVAITAFTLTYAIQFSGYAFAWGKVVFGVLMWVVLDHTIFRKIETLKLIKEGNIAVAILFLATAVIIAGALSGL